MVPRERRPQHLGVVSSIDVPGWRKFLEKALEARNSYESHLSAIMQQHGISSEAELFTGVISTHSRFNSMKHDRENAEIVIAKQCEHLLQTTRTRFEEDLKDSFARYEPDDDEESSMLKRQLASAWFMAVYGEEDKERRFFSFPWSIASILVETLKWLKSKSSPFGQTRFLALEYHNALTMSVYNLNTPRRKHSIGNACSNLTMFRKFQLSPGTRWSQSRGMCCSRRSKPISARVVTL